MSHGKIVMQPDFTYGEGMVVTRKLREKFEIHKIEENWKDGKAPIGENAPAYRVCAPGGLPEYGGIWMKESQGGKNKGMKFMQLEIDDPDFEHPFRAACFASNDEKTDFNIVWSRPKKQQGED